MADLICKECGRCTEVLYDHTTGDTVCAECGLVLETHNIEERSELRAYTNETGEANDVHNPNRVGQPDNPLLDHAELGTTIKNNKGTTNEANVVVKKLTRLNSGSNSKEDHLTTAFNILTMTSEKLGLVGKIKDRACELYKKVHELGNYKVIRGKGTEPMLGACLLVACQQENLPRTVKEICSVFCRDTVTKKDVLKAKIYIIKELISGNEENNNGSGGIVRTLRAADLVKRFCSNLGIMNNWVTKAAQEAATKCEESIDLRRSPVSVAAAVIYLVGQMMTIADNVVTPAPTLKDISVVSEVAETTIKNTCRDIFPHVEKIVPSWYATKDELNNLQCP